MALLGLAGGHVAFGFEALAPEAALTTVVAGTVLDLHDVVRLAQRDAFSMPLSPYPLDGINEAISLICAPAESTAAPSSSPGGSQHDRSCAAGSR